MKKQNEEEVLEDIPEEIAALDRVLPFRPKVVLSLLAFLFLALFSLYLYQINLYQDPNDLPDPNDFGNHTSLNEEDVEIDIISIQEEYRAGDQFLSEGNIEKAREYYQQLITSEETVPEELVFRRILTLPIEDKVHELLIMAFQEEYSGDARARALETIALMYMTAETEQEKSLVTDLVFITAPLSSFYVEGDEMHAYERLLEIATSLGEAPLADSVISGFYYDEIARMRRDVNAEYDASLFSSYRRIADQRRISVADSENFVRASVVPEYIEILTTRMDELEEKSNVTAELF